MAPDCGWDDDCQRAGWHSTELNALNEILKKSASFITDSLKRRTRHFLNTHRKQKQVSMKIEEFINNILLAFL